MHNVDSHVNLTLKRVVNKFRIERIEGAVRLCNDLTNGDALTVGDFVTAEEAECLCTYVPHKMVEGASETGEDDDVVFPPIHIEVIL